MLPFLKKQEGSASDPIDPIERKHDDDFDFLDAIAGDVISAVEKKDKSLLKEALGALCEYIQEIDEQQDKEQTK